HNLATHFRTDEGIAKAVGGVSFSVGQGETLALVGESGCGKSVTALSILRLVPPPGRIVQGRIIYQGQDLSQLSAEGIRRVRGKEISMIFQEPMTSLNPVFTIGRQIAETLEVHEKTTHEEVFERVLEMLRLVGIPSPELRVHEYPHHLSGGMRQRIMIAMALICHPAILIADEPTTALDVTIQAQILALLNRLQSELQMSVILITHDLGVVAQNAHRVAVMYAGRIVEFADVDELFSLPLHPYTIGLFESLPSMHDRKTRLRTIPGTVPNPARIPGGCPFHPRCPIGDQHCVDNVPQLEELRPRHRVSCWKARAEGTMPFDRSPQAPRKGLRQQERE
ncbi:MAG: ATP-binding cassette domain-containing protein, partial [Anaerolineaceae bacterium]|nr:ATP-binding cassette domain-containing protein [Anaerolineaceae bacterium]